MKKYYNKKHQAHPDDAHTDAKKWFKQKGRKKLRKKLKEDLKKEDF